MSGPRQCPYCGFMVVGGAHGEVHHMENYHPEIVERRLREAGMHREADEFAERSRS